MIVFTLGMVNFLIQCTGVHNTSTSPQVGNGRFGETGIFQAQFETGFIFLWSQVPPGMARMAFLEEFKRRHVKTGIQRELFHSGKEDFHCLGVFSPSEYESLTVWQEEWRKGVFVVILVGVVSLDSWTVDQGLGKILGWWGVVCKVEVLQIWASQLPLSI